MDGDPFVLAALGRLQRASLLEVVERAAKRNDLLVRHVLTRGEVTGGHRAAWQALRGAGRTATEIAGLVGFPVAVVAQGLAEEVPGDAAPAPVAAPPKPTAKESRPKAPPKAPKPTKAPRAVALPEVPDLEVPAAVPPRKTEWQAVSTISKCLRAAERAGMLPHLHAAAERHGVTVTAIVGAGRDANIVRARREAVWRLSALAGLSSVRIGLLLGERDHSTILDYLKKFTPDAALLALVPKREAA